MYKVEVKQNIIGVEFTSGYGHKHFAPWIDLSDFSFPLQDEQNFLNNSDHCLCILIVRNVYDWIRSFYRKQHHAHISMSEMGFLNFISSIWATDDYEPARSIDRLNPYTGQPFKNVLELRKFKLMNQLSIGKGFKNFVVVRYEDLLEAPEQFIEFIAQKYHLEAKIEFDPVTKYKGNEPKAYKKRTYPNFEKAEFLFLNDNVDWELERMVGYHKMKLKEVNSSFWKWLND